MARKKCIIFSVYIGNRHKKCQDLKDTEEFAVIFRRIYENLFVGREYK